jgi:hypothetical protein
MENRKIIFAGAGGILLVLILAVVFFIGGSTSPTSETPGATTTDPFGNGSGARPIGGGGAGENPFGDGGYATSGRPGIVTDETAANRRVGIIEKLHQPASAAAILFAANERREVVERALFVDRSTGHLYRKNLAEDESVVKYTNTTIPRVQQALMSSNGSSTIFQYLNATRQGTEAFSGSVTTPPRADTRSPEEEAAFMTLSGRFLPQGIKSIAFSPQHTKIAYVAKRSEGGSSIVVANTDGTNAVEIGTLPFEDLTIGWRSINMIEVTTASSADAPGVSYHFTPIGASSMHLLGVPGLNTLGSPDGTRVLYSGTENGVTALYLYTVATRESKRLPVETLAEKCAWSTTDTQTVYCAVPRTLPGKGYPDSWYRGEYEAEDIIWRINVVAETTDIIAPQIENPVSFDAVSLVVGPREEHLLFINRTDDTLYSVGLPLVPVAID